MDSPVSRYNRFTRRRFLKQTVAAAGTAGLACFVPAAALGKAVAVAPSNRITIGCIGTGRMGTSNIKAFMAKPDAQIIAVCDVDANHREQARELAGLDSRDAYNDFRHILARNDIDAVVITTPDHWHVPIAIAAAKAGKDIYCEKPLSLTIAEGHKLSDAVKRYRRVFQTGSQQRSDNNFRFACELVRNGRIGKVHTIRVGIPGNSRLNPLKWQPQPVPKGFDYDMWLGQAPSAPYTEKRCHYNFRFLFDYSGGQLTNWGAHHLDIAQWANGTSHTGPIRIGGRGEFPKEGLFNTATRVDIEYTYANGVKLKCFTGGSGMTYDYTGGVKFEGTQGWLYVGRGKLDAKPKSILESKIKPDEINLYHSIDHRQNFLDCVKTRKAPVADVEIGHRSVTLCHLGNIAMLLGRKLRWDPSAEQFENDCQANRFLSRPMRNPYNL